ncbi:MAG: RagB/SusD family nutrient uptake outer membrane protein [Bacteroidales bacterium]|nr:RagB/SusD family nutrient uptake outer membrane protein [Bacteroidales bacterium]MBN2699630.1 RagB/SusD family nutrient uptake outer membrane protein [Bacteroidales bacterium]
MKHTFAKPLLFLLLPLAAGCTDWLDIRPESEVVLEDYWQNETQANQVVAACYRSFTEANNIRRMIVWGEVRSDNIIQGRGTDNNVAKILDVDINASNPYCGWASIYTTINYCNNFLHFAPGVVDTDKNFTIGKLRSLEAEILTLRALAYFYLVRAFGEVPLVLEPSIDDTQEYNLPKSPEREILDQIIADLKDAAGYARTSYDKTDYPKARITQNAVRALLADIYLWDQRYELCIAECDRILNDESLKLIDAQNMYRKVFYESSASETIFEFAFNDDEIRNDAVRSFYGYSGNIEGQLSFPVFLVDGQRSPFEYLAPGGGMESENDIRLKDFINISNAMASGYYYIFKYAGTQRVENQTGQSNYFYTNFSPSWIVYRLPDVILMKAEALVQLNRNESDLREALHLVNTTYLRANPDLVNDSLRFENYSGQIQMEELVLRERQRELMFEGKRWFDLMRLAKREDSPERLLSYVMPKFSGDQALQYSKMSVMDALYFPILQAEIDANPALVQNPFYELTGTGSSAN